MNAANWDAARIRGSVVRFVAITAALFVADIGAAGEEAQDGKDKNYVSFFITEPQSLITFRGYIGYRRGERRKIGLLKIQPETHATGSGQVLDGKKRPTKYRADDLFRWKGRIPPKLNIAAIAVRLNGKPFQRTMFHPLADWGFTTELPYAPNTVEIAIDTSDGKQMKRTVAVPRWLELDSKFDARKQPDENNNKGQQRGAELDVRIPEGRGYLISSVSPHVTCISSAADGRITHARLVMKQHPDFTPERDEDLLIIAYAQPVHRAHFGSTVDVRSLRKEGEYGSAPATAIELVIECRTDRNVSMVASQRVELPAIPVGE